MHNLTTISKLADNGAQYRNWYTVAHAQLDLAFDTRAGLVADLLAVTSPRVHLKRNCGYVSDILNGRKPMGMIRSVRTSVQTYFATGKILGKKTGPFARCLRGCQDSLVLDTWMSFAFDVYQPQIHRKDIYSAIANCVGKIASANNWTIAETQAAIWSGTLLGQNRSVGYLPIHLIQENENV